MPESLTTTVTELPESRVRLEVQVPAAELEERLQRKARQLGRELKLAGFRRGKVPPPLVIQRVGREVILEEAVRDTLSSWYSDAIQSAGIVPVGDPEVDLGELPPQGEALEFSIDIGVLPKAQLGDYKGLEVGRREVDVTEDQIDQEIQQLREKLAKLESIDRPAQSGDFVVIDYVGQLPGDSGELEPFADGEGRDQLVELGAGNLIPGFEEGLEGASAGQTRTIELSFPEDYPNGELAGRDASFDITVKDVKAKQLPEVNEDFAADVGYDTIADLRGDIAERLTATQTESIAGEFREGALDAAVAQAKVEVPSALIEARAREMWERTLHSLSHRGITRDAYLKILAREETQILAELAPDAERALRREAVITAVVAAEAIAPSEADLLEAIAPTAEREGLDPEKMLGDLRKRGRLDGLREDLAARQAIELIAEQAKPIGLEQARAREQIWTPEKEDPEGSAGQLWTPES
ncbi:MAG TPA: trigger factor [Solirubrobacteraceae bacterium]